MDYPTHNTVCHDGQFLFSVVPSVLRLGVPPWHPPPVFIFPDSQFFTLPFLSAHTSQINPSSQSPERLHGRSAERRELSPGSLQASLRTGDGVFLQTKCSDESKLQCDYQMNDTIEHKKWGRGVIQGNRKSVDFVFHHIFYCFLPQIIADALMKQRNCPS